MFFSKYKMVVGFAIYSLVTLHVAQSHAISLSQKPLFLTSGAEPNLMFVLDDSGSMQFEITPETYRLQPYADTVFSFPPADQYYGANAFNAKAAIPGNVNSDYAVYGKLFRSKVNTSYYDPSKLYLPWISTDGITTMPNASATCALHNPMNPLTVSGVFDAKKCRNLTDAASTRVFATKTSAWWGCKSATDCKTGSSISGSHGSWTIYPATYYWFTGNVNNQTDVWNKDNYQEQKIINTTLTYSGHGRGDARTDCSLVGVVRTCTYAQEIQNFANWYTYYRSRVLTARAGIGRAFAPQQDDIRVGFGTINRDSSTVDGVATEIIKTGVRKFDATRKTEFLTELYGVTISGGTPLPNALDYIGQYYMRSDNRGPWGKLPGTDNPTPHVQCRASYALLMSDGYWTSRVTTAGNNDNTAGAEIVNHITGGKYQYQPTAPFADSESNSLADVAMKYWKTDLRSGATGLENRVKPNAIDPAFWQHMTTFTIGLGVEGNISVKSVPDAIATGKNSTGGTISWPTLEDSAENGTKVDDMLHAAINGRGDFFSAKDPDTFARRMSGLLDDINGRAKNNAAAAAANSTTLNTGSVVYNALFDSNDWSGDLKATEINSSGVFATTPLWTASIPAAASRNIYTFNGSVGKSLVWTNLTTSQKNLLKGTSGSDTIGQKRLDWFKGVDDTVENDAADVRDRKGRLLGDIVNSDPAFAGNTNLNYDDLHADLGAATYIDYYNTKKKNRREMLYVGANDGMLHGFNARVSSSDPVPAGREVFAYVPTQVIANIPDLASERYGKDNTKLHKYMVDGPVYVSDAYVNGGWKNVLVGTLGAGGRGIYVLDVTSPDSFGADNVLFELTEAQYPELGYITGMAVIAPGADKRWKIFVGNGYNSTQGGSAKAYLGVIDIDDEINRARNNWVGSSRTKFISTDNVAESALSEPALLPNGDGLIVSAYAGDIRGNMWKFNLPTGTAYNTWVAANSGVPLFVAKKGSTRQPITASPTLGFNKGITPARVMVYFGTGMYVASNDNQPSVDVQSFYAIVDKGVAIPEANGRNNFHIKSFTETGGLRTIGGEINTDNTNAINWASVNGWYLDFPANERVITRPLLAYDRLVFPTVIPSQDPCESGGTGWIMELKATGEPNPQYKLLGTNGNKFQKVAIFGRLTSIEGSYKDAVANSSSPVSSGASSSVSNECGGANGDGSGIFVAIGNQSQGESVSAVGSKPCDLFNRQSWRELE